MVLLIDNYDSFTYNLVQTIGALGRRIETYRHDAITLRAIQRKRPSHIIISPGPKTPQEAGISPDVIAKFSGRIPILGVCLGHQCLAVVFGCKVVRAPRLMHGKTSRVYHDRRTIYRGLPNPFTAARYHSLIVTKESLPDCFQVTAWTKENEIMGIRHRTIPALEGVQFHPESFLTPTGKRLLRNFLNLPARR